MTTQKTDQPSPQKEARAVVVWRVRYSTHGRKVIDFECPFCHSTLEGFSWSLAGSGKRCDCGAKIQGPRHYSLTARKVSTP